MTLWRPIPIPFVASRYEASDDGRIMTHAYDTTVTRKGNSFPKHVKSRILKSRISGTAPSSGIHPVVNIYMGTSRGDCRNRQQRVARLVAAAFYGVPYDPTKQSEIQRWRIRFIDNDPLNVHAVNLEWVHSFGQGGNSREVQARYARNLDGFRGSDPRSTLSRLFGEAA